MTAVALHTFASARRSAVRWPAHPKEIRLADQRRVDVPDLNDILRLVAEGDRSAFADLYDAMSGAVFGVVKRVVRSKAHAEEVTQEVFLEVWWKAARWDPDRGAATTWVLIIARARATDRVRSEQASRDRQDRVAPAWTEPLIDTVVEEIATRDEHREVRHHLSALTDLQREVIELAYFGGRTYVEVAEYLGVPVGTVKTRMRDGLIRLRQVYGVMT